MPPWDMTPGLKALSGQWVGVLSGAFGTETATGRRLLNTQETYSLIYNAQVDAGVAPGGFTMRDLNTMRSTATSWRRSAEGIARAQDTSPLSPDLIALAPWSRDLASRNAAPLYEVRYEMRINTPDGERSSWISIGAEQAGIPSSIGELRDLVEQHAADVEAGGGSPPFEAGELFSGVGNILVVAV